LTKPRGLILMTLSLSIAALLSACGGGSSVVSASAVATCAHAQQQPVGNLPSGASSQHAVVAKVAPGGWLRQDYSAVEQAERNQPAYEIYVFNNERAAGEAFNLISSAPNAQQEYGAGGTFRRRNVIINADGESDSLTADAETLLNKCAGAGASQSVIRAPEEVHNGRTPSERTRSEEDGAAPETGEAPKEGE
jgi:hypothetical protein